MRDTIYAGRPLVPGHNRVDLGRYRRGMTPIRPARTLYGWRWTCECGTSQRTNERKREATALWRQHRLAFLR